MEELDEIVEMTNELTYDEREDNRLCEENEKAEFVEKNVDALQKHFDGLREWGGRAITKDNCYDLFEDWATSQSIYELKDALGQMDLEKESIKQN